MTENPQPRTLQKWWKFCTISKCAENIFWQNFCSTHQKKLFLQISGSFRKIEFLTENPQPRTLQKWWKFCTISKCAKKIFFAKLFVPLIKRSVSTNFKAVFGKLNFWQKIHSRGPYKNGENFVLSQNRLRKYFFAKFFVPLIKRSVSTNFKAGFGKLNFWRKIHSRGPYKNGENFHTISKCAKKIFFGKILCSTHQKSVSTNFKAVFGKLNFWQKIHSRGPYKNGENFVLSQNVLRKYFLATLFVPLIKRSFSTNFQAVFGKLNFWRKIHSRGPYKNGENFVLSQNVLRKYFLAKFFVPLIKRSVSTNFKAGFGKLNFWLKIHSRGPYKNGDNFVLSQNVLRKYFLAKFFVPLIKRSVSTNFKAVFGKLNFWQKIHSRGPYKNGENFVLSQNLLWKYFLAILFHSSKEAFLQTFRLKIEFLTENLSRGPYKNGENFYYLKMYSKC